MTDLKITGKPSPEDYYRNEWGVPCHDDARLYEYLVLEWFQAGVSWAIVLGKRENFRNALDGFDVNKVSKYGEDRIGELMQDKGIIRNRAKLRATVRNSGVFINIQKEFGSFDSYIWHFTEGKTVREPDLSVTTSNLSDTVSADLKKRGMSFVGSTTVYSYLQGIGIIDSRQ